jgi:pimeloyl-ACP methyl ester carboxylesterase
LVLWGTDDTIVPYTHNKRLSGILVHLYITHRYVTFTSLHFVVLLMIIPIELLPLAKLVTIEAGGHGIHMQRSDEFNRELLAFLQQPLP